MELIIDFFSRALWNVVSASYDTAPFWAPLVLAVVAARTWVYYARANYLASQKWTILEIKLPRDTFKSPLAMEVVLNALHQTIGESTWYDKYILGKTRTWFSLELVSIEGKVRFFLLKKLQVFLILLLLKASGKKACRLIFPCWGALCRMQNRGMTSSWSIAPI